MSKFKLNRREALRFGAIGSLAAALPGGLLLDPSRALGNTGEDARYLFIITASGGGSILDSFWPTARGEVSGEEARTNQPLTYLDDHVEDFSGTRLRASTLGQNRGNFGAATWFFDHHRDTPEFPIPSLKNFVEEHRQQMLVAINEVTSVNHVVAQHRAITGNDVAHGKTLMEFVAEQCSDPSALLTLPNCNASTGGYVKPGTDESLDARFRGTNIASAAGFQRTTHSHYRLPAPLPEITADQISKSRALRDLLEGTSPFNARYGSRVGTRRERFLNSLADAQNELEGQNFPTALAGVLNDPELNKFFPLAEHDRLQQKARLAFALVKQGFSRVVTIGPGATLNTYPMDMTNDTPLIDAPIAFDFSHNSHRQTQTTMWHRIMGTAHCLINALTQAELWKQSVIYIATDFGRTPTGFLDYQDGDYNSSLGSGHDVRSANVIIDGTDTLQGNLILGGKDPNTGDLYTCDATQFGLDADIKAENWHEGDPDNSFFTNGSSRTEEKIVREGHVFSIVCEAMGMDTRSPEMQALGLKNVSGLRRQTG